MNDDHTTSKKTRDSERLSNVHQGTRWEVNEHFQSLLDGVALRPRSASLQILNLLCVAGSNMCEGVCKHLSVLHFHLHELNHTRLDSPVHSNNS